MPLEKVSLQLSCRHWKAARRSSWNLLFLLQAEQPQISHPVLIWEVLQPSDHPHGLSMDLLQLHLREKKGNTSKDLQGWPSCRLLLPNGGVLGNAPANDGQLLWNESGRLEQPIFRVHTVKWSRKENRWWNNGPEISYQRNITVFCFLLLCQVTRTGTGSYFLLSLLEKVK